VGNPSITGHMLHWEKPLSAILYNTNIIMHDQHWQSLQFLSVFQSKYSV